MSGLRDIFFKPKREPNMMVEHFLDLDTLVKRQLQKQGLTVEDINVLEDLCTKMKREDLLEPLLQAKTMLWSLEVRNQPSPDYKQM